MSERAEGYQTTSGHGHVTPRRDGALARCGGPAICATCQEEQRQMDAVHRRRQARAPEPLTPERLAAIRGMCERFAADRKVIPCSPGPAPETRLADAGLVLLAEIDRMRDALTKLNAIRDRSIRTHRATWASVMYPLVAILNEAGFPSTVTDDELNNAPVGNRLNGSVVTDGAAGSEAER